MQIPFSRSPEFKAVVMNDICLVCCNLFLRSNSFSALGNLKNFQPCVFSCVSRSDICVAFMEQLVSWYQCKWVLLVLQVCATNAQELASLKETQKVKEALDRRTSGCGKGFVVIRCEFSV